MRKLAVSELQRLSIAEFKQQPKIPIVLVLDSVRSALNVGSAFRTADAFLVEKIYLCGITAQPPNKEITKTALGATESVEWVYESDVAAALHRLKQQGYMIAAVEQAEGSVALQDFKMPEKVALIFGNEVAGVSEAAMAMADASIEIPQLGTKHSLNIAVCVGIVVWELFKRFKT